MNQPWNPCHQTRLRLIDAGSDEGGSNTSDPATREPGAGDIDWKAKFEAERAHSREWEKRAKDNKAAADELQQLKESQMSEQQKAEARTMKLQKELDQLKAEKQASAWRSQVMTETGLPANLVIGSTLEEMQANAKAINEYVAEKSKTGDGGYRLSDPSRQPHTAPTDLQQFAASVFSGN
ncbi:DUF4355 domain-containing protein [Bifidobacterium saguini]|nr:DUF4355 domain-containing protein [Bifidobacterium saguini]